jgi:hypothetical protein
MKKRNVVLIIVALFLIIPLAIDVISILDRYPSDNRYEEILQAIVASPDEVVLKQNELDITSDFLDKYKTPIENGNYSEAIDFLKKNGISITISINGSNEFLLDGME